MRWYVSERGKASGPYTEDHIAVLASWGKISRKAYVCDEYCSCWIPITRSPFAPRLANISENEGEGADSIGEVRRRLARAARDGFTKLPVALWLALSVAAALLLTTIARADDRSPPALPATNVESR